MSYPDGADIPAGITYRNSATNNDRWAVHLFSSRRGGYFIEAGALDGISGSCTWVLEHHFGWRGILVEPGTPFAALAKNRPASARENACLCGHDGTVTFYEAGNPGYSGILPTLVQTEADHLARWGTTRNQWREGGGRERSCPAVTFATLLQRHHAPPRIDYVALDIEGAELEALRLFPFDRHEVVAFSIEGDSCDAFLLGKGYVGVKNPFNEEAPWERYYVHSGHLGELHT